MSSSNLQAIFLISTKASAALSSFERDLFISLSVAKFKILQSEFKFFHYLHE